MSVSTDTPWLRRYACFTALATFILVGIGGLVTSHNAGMAVPDWPNSYGYNMFLFPVSKWVGGILYEHTHRLVASFVGVLVVGLTRWLGGRPSRVPLALIGLGEMLAGAFFLRLGGDWKGAGYFLAGIAGVVLLAAAVWARNEPSSRPLPLLGWVAFVTVQLQGLLGGLRVVLFKDEIGIFHATLAQLFFVLLCTIALLMTRWWKQFSLTRRGGEPKLGLPSALYLITAATLLILAQLILGATMRHQHAGLAIPDFPLAYGKVWPAMDSASVELYNQKRLEATAVNPITSFQIALQMAHRIMAVLILAGVAFSAWLTRRHLGWRNPLSKMTVGWVILIVAQGILGAATIWSDKAADVATAHVLLGALSLASGTLITLVTWRTREITSETAVPTTRELAGLLHSECGSSRHEEAQDSAVAVTCVKMEPANERNPSPLIPLPIGWGEGRPAAVHWYHAALSESSGSPHVGCYKAKDGIAPA